MDKVAEVVAMEKKLTPLKTKIVKTVKNECPLTQKTCEFPLKNFSYKRCLECPYFVKGKGDGSCGWYEYKTTYSQRYEIDDPYSAGPTDYYRTIKCAYCGFRIQFYSSYSCFVCGDAEVCPECKLFHTFLKSERPRDEIICFFAIPIKQWEAKASAQA